MIEILLWVVFVLVVWSLLGEAINQIILETCGEAIIDRPRLMMLSAVLSGPLFWWEIAKIYFGMDE